MKYLSIDIETSGLDWDKCVILSIAAVVEDTNNLKPLSELPTFNAYVIHHNICGDMYALNMNRDIISKISEYNKLLAQPFGEERNKKLVALGTFYQQDEVLSKLGNFIKKHFGNKESTDRILCTVAGKNFAGFDLNFIKKLPNWEGFNRYVGFRHKVIDPGPIFIDWENDTEVPSLNVCIERTKVGGEVTHDALQDAIDVIRVLRHIYDWSDVKE